MEEFFKRMGWSTNPMANEEKVKWHTAMKFLIPVKFDVTRAIELYRTHEVRRKEWGIDGMKMFVLFRIFVKTNILIEYRSLILI